MLVKQMLSRKSDGRCFPCFALVGDSAQVEPHAALSLVDRVELASGTREEFVCASCGQGMVRFLATQTSPPPSNKWRYEQQRAVSACAVSTEPVGERADEAQEAPDCNVALDPIMLGETDEPLQEPPAFSLFHAMHQ
jgi:hypothetical protein